MYSKEAKYWVAGMLIPQIGPRTFLRLLTKFSNIQELYRADKTDFRQAKIPEKFWDSIKQVNWPRVQKELEWANKNDCHIICYTDIDYPNLLKEIPNPPLVLYAMGNITQLCEVQIAIVGSRKCSGGGIKNAEYFAEHLVQAGFYITSGLALGIDTVCHKAALKNKGVTIGVAGTGLNQIYPQRNKHLYKEIISNNGVIISEFPLATLAYPSNFPRRNRIISGLSRGVVVVEAALKSGSLITAIHALEQGRDVFAIPGSIHNPMVKGCHYLIKQGAILLETPNELIEYYAHLPQIELPLSKQIDADIPAIEAKFSQILVQIDYEITPMDVILLRSGLTAGELSSILLTLEFNGYIQSVVGGYVRIDTKVKS